MAWTPDPNLFNSAFGGGLRAGSALADLVRQRRQESELQRLAQMAEAENFSGLGSGLIGMGQVGAGINALQVPYERQRADAMQQFNLDNAMWQRQQAGREFDYRAQRDAEERAMKERALSMPQVEGGFVYDPRDPAGTARPLGGENAGMFTGNSVQAQALNRLVSQGEITATEAAMLGAGKTVQFPDGSTMFMTPQGLMRGYNPAPAQGNVVSQATTAAPNLPPPGTPIPGQAPSPARPGAIRLTPPRPPEMNEGQAKAAGFADRIEQALPTLFDNPAFTDAGMSRMQRAMGALPVVGNSMISPEYQQFDQAQRNIINAILRRESGAVISDQEFANAARQYIPQPGDSEQVLAQKKQNLRTVLESYKRDAGANYRPVNRVEVGGYTIEQVD